MSTLTDPAENQPSELDVLKQRATLMGIQFSNNIGLETLRKKIADKQEGNEEEPSLEAAQAEQQGIIDGLQKANPLAGQDAPGPRKTLRQHLIDEQMKLVRVRITNMDPKKKDLPGEIFTVANEYLGTVRKYIPYGEVTDDGWHIPYIIFKQLEDRRFLNIRTVKDRRTGTNRISSTDAKEFALEVLPPLTQAELNKLATAQAAAGSVD